MVAGSILALCYVRRLMPAPADRKAPATYEAREVLGASGPMMAARITGYANSWGMVWTLGLFALAREVGIYNAASRTAALSGLVLLAFDGILWSVISNLYRRSSMDHLNRLHVDGSCWIFTGSLAIFLPTALLSKDVLAVFGNEFVAGWLAVAVIAAGYLVSSSVGLTARRWRPSSASWGAALATATGLSLVYALTVFLVRRLRGSWPYNRLYLKSLAAGLLAALGVSLLRWALALPEGVVAALVLGPTFLALFAVVIVALGLSDSDRQFSMAFWTAVRRVSETGRGA